MTDSNDFKWKIVERWQEYRSEIRVNILRVSCILVFYGIELVNFFGLKIGSLELVKVVDLEFHKKVSYLALAWSLMAGAVFFCLIQRFFPPILKYLTTSFDLLALTILLFIADGALSPLIICYFLIVMLSASRFNLLLVRFTTAGAVLGYLFTNGYARWRDLPRPPHYHLLIFTVTIVLTGIILGQIVRQARSLSEEYLLRSQN